MRVLLCGMCKLENNYLDEWINHHLNLGVSKIVIIDNNDTYGEFAENIYDVKSVRNNIDNKIIEIYPLNNGKYLQQIYYQKVYEKYKNDFDWFLFLDIDEFLILNNHKTLEDFINQEKFKNYNAIRINWKCYGDNDLVEVINNNYNLKERFTKEIKDSNQNFLVKTLFKSFNDEEILFPNSHGPIACTINSCDTDGNQLYTPQHPKILNICHDDAYIAHYITKTIEEYCLTKFKRGGSAQSNLDLNSKYKIDLFFKFNRYTNNKEKIIKKYLGNQFTKRQHHKVLFIGPCFMRDALRYIPALLNSRPIQPNINIDFLYSSDLKLKYLIDNLDTKITDYDNKTIFYRYKFKNDKFDISDLKLSLNQIIKNRYDYIIYSDANLNHLNILNDTSDDYINNTHKTFIDNIKSISNAKIIYYTGHARYKYSDEFKNKFNFSTAFSISKTNKELISKLNSYYDKIKNRLNIDIINSTNELDKLYNNYEVNDILIDGSHLKSGFPKYHLSKQIVNEFLNKILSIKIDTNNNNFINFNENKKEINLTSSYSFGELKYCNRKRWDYYYEQLIHSLNNTHKSYLIIGPGDGIIPKLIEHLNNKSTVKTFDIKEGSTYTGNLIDIDKIVNEKFDCILCCNVLEHIEFEYFIKIIKYLEKISNKLIISIPEFNNKICKYHKWEINNSNKTNIENIKNIINPDITYKIYNNHFFIKNGEN